MVESLGLTGNCLANNKGYAAFRSGLWHAFTTRRATNCRQYASACCQVGEDFSFAREKVNISGECGWARVPKRSHLAVQRGEFGRR